MRKRAEPRIARRGGKRKGGLPEGHSHESGAKLIGLFNVSILHNIVHLLFGIAGIAMARTANTARTFLVGGGVIYLVLWVYWLVIDQQSMANFIPVNSADNWLHFVLASG